LILPIEADGARTKVFILAPSLLNI